LSSVELHNLPHILLLSTIQSTQRQSTCTHTPNRSASLSLSLSAYLALSPSVSPTSRALHPRSIKCVRKHLPLGRHSCCSPSSHTLAMSITRSGDPASARAAASASASGTAKTTTTAKAPTPAATPSAPPELAPAPVLAPAPTPTPVAAPAAPAQPAQPAQKRKYTRRAPAKPRGRAGKAAPSTRPTSKIEALGAAVRPGPALLPGAEAPAAAAAVLSLSPSAALVRSRAVAFECEYKYGILKVLVLTTTHSVPPSRRDRDVQRAMPDHSGADGRGGEGGGA
jgi:hypothetical protein